MLAALSVLLFFLFFFSRCFVFSRKKLMLAFAGSEHADPCLRGSTGADQANTSCSFCVTKSAAPDVNRLRKQMQRFSQCNAVTQVHRSSVRPCTSGTMACIAILCLKKANSRASPLFPVRRRRPRAAPYDEQQERSLVCTDERVARRDSKSKA